MGKKKQDSSKPAKKRRTARRPNPLKLPKDFKAPPIGMEDMLACAFGFLVSNMMRPIIRESLRKSAGSKLACDCDCHVLGIYGGVPCPKECLNYGAKFGQQIT